MICTCIGNCIHGLEAAFRQSLTANRCFLHVCLISFGLFSIRRSNCEIKTSHWERNSVACAHRKNACCSLCCLSLPASPSFRLVILFLFGDLLLHSLRISEIWPDMAVFCATANPQSENYNIISCMEFRHVWNRQKWDRLYHGSSLREGNVESKRRDVKG